MSLFFNGTIISVKEIAVFILMFIYSTCLIVFASLFYAYSEKKSEITNIFKKYITKNKVISNHNKSSIRPTYFSISTDKRNSCVRVFFAELKLTFNSQSIIWNFIFFIGILLCLFMDLSFVQLYILPLFMLLGINIFSEKGIRDHIHGTMGLITATPSGGTQIAICKWLSGLTFALLMVLPVILRMLLINQINGVLAALGGVFFLPSLAFFTSGFTKSSRAFELIFISITYATLNNVSMFMYLGIHPDIVSPLRAVIYLILGVVLGIITVFTVD
jgi:hypothetical protein